MKRGPSATAAAQQKLDAALVRADSAQAKADLARAKASVTRAQIETDGKHAVIWDPKTGEQKVIKKR